MFRRWFLKPCLARLAEIEALNQRQIGILRCVLDAMNLLRQENSNLRRETMARLDELGPVVKTAQDTMTAAAALIGSLRDQLAAAQPGTDEDPRIGAAVDALNAANGQLATVIAPPAASVPAPTDTAAAPVPDQTGAQTTAAAASDPPLPS